MRTNRILLSLCLAAALALTAPAQVQKVLIPAGTPEDVALQKIAAEPDAARRVELYQGFVAQFSANPDAVAYGYSQIAEYHLNSGDPAQALAFGDKALAAMPGNLDVLVQQANAAQQLKDAARTLEYAARGGLAVNGIRRKPKPEGVTDEVWASQLETERRSVQQLYEYLMVAALNAIAGETDGKRRLDFCERYTTAFPGSPYDEQVAQHAIAALMTMNNYAGIAAYAEKALAGNPNNVGTLAILAAGLAEDPKGTYLPKAVAYAQKAIELSKGEGEATDPSRRLAVGMAHSALGYALLKQEKNPPAIAALKTASEFLKDDPGSYSTVMFRLGFAYAKLKRYGEAREALNQVAKMEGPFQQPARDLLVKIDAAGRQR